MYIVITSKITGLKFYVLNNALSATTSVSLFFSNKEYYLNITIHSECDIVFS